MTKDLEKEAEEKAKEFSEHPLKEFCKFPLHWTDFDKSKESCYMNGYLAGAEPREKRIAELGKENAELKEELKDADEKVVHLACNQNKDLKYKLTKAKEIIDNFLDFESSCQERGIYISDEMREKANKFLEEE